MNAQIRTHPEIQVEPLGTRVALHPFLAGMNHTQLTLLTDCAVARHFNIKPDNSSARASLRMRFYLVETGKGGARVSGRLWRIDPDTNRWRRRLARAGRGCSRHTSGNLQHARSNRPLRCFSTAAILREYCEKDHSLGYELLKRISAVMVTRLQAARIPNAVALLQHACRVSR